MYFYIVYAFYYDKVTISTIYTQSMLYQHLYATNHKQSH